MHSASCYTWTHEAHKTQHRDLCYRVIVYTLDPCWSFIDGDVRATVIVTSTVIVFLCNVNHDELR